MGLHETKKAEIEEICTKTWKGRNDIDKDEALILWEAEHAERCRELEELQKRFNEDKEFWGDTSVRENLLAQANRRREEVQELKKQLEEKDRKILENLDRVEDMEVQRLWKEKEHSSLYTEGVAKGFQLAREAIKKMGDKNEK